MKNLLPILLLCTLPCCLSAHQDHDESETPLNTSLTTPPLNDLENIKELSSPPTNETIETEIENTIRLLEEGEADILLDERKDSTIVLGLTGAGKSTVVQLLAGDNSKLISVEVGKGEFIIVDENGHIGNSTLQSQTIIPELVIDKESNAAYYDCPGFSDTRNASFDIAASYFVNKVLEHASSVKILFIVDHSTVRTSVDRVKFMEFLKHVTTLINDIDYFNTSMAVVINKVENQFVEDDDGNYVLVSDAEMSKNVAEFFNHEVISYLESEIASGNIDSDKIITYKKSIKMLNIFLTVENDVYKYMALFRRPLKEGPLSENKAAQNSRNKIIKILTEDLHFVLTDSKDFSNTISDDSKLFIISLVNKLTAIIVTKCNDFQSQTMEYILQKCKQSTEIYDLYVDFEKILKILLNVDGCNTNIEGSKILNVYFCTIYSIGYNLPVEDVTDIIKYLNFLTYFANFMDSDNNEISFTEVEILQNKLMEFFKTYHSWYTFLYNFYQKMSEYSFQSEREKYNVADIENWGKPNTPQGIFITSVNIHNFLQKLDSYNIIEYNNVIRDENIKDFIIRDLNKILNITLKVEININNPSTKILRISGENIVISSVVNVIKNKSIDILEIFALNTVHIDSDILEHSDELQIVIASPKSNLIGTRRIVLDGVAADKQDSDKASDGRFEGENGEDGKPGYPGHPSGSFLTLAKNFNDGKLLTVTTNGGVGGRGQEGGNGATGKEGKQPTLDTCQDRTWCEKGLSFDSLEGQSCTHNQYDSKRESYYKGTQYQLKFTAYYSIRCNNGFVGGNGGNGGKAGFGGNTGEHFVVSLSGTESNVNFVSAQGLEGDPGNGGTGGKGGIQGKEMQAVYTRIGYVPAAEFWKNQDRCFQWLQDGSRCYTEQCYTRYPGGSTTNADSGKNGVKGGNDNGIQKPANIREFQKVSEINAYKYYLRESIEGSIGHGLIEDIYTEIENNDDIQKWQKTVYFINEIKDLEIQYRILKNQYNILPFYESFLMRVKKFADSFKEETLPVSDKMLLNYVLSTAISRICVIKSKSERNLIIDLLKFMDVAQTNINNMKELENSATSLEVRNSYKSSINKKIDEALFLVDTYVNSELENLQVELDSDVEILLNETLILLENAEENKIQLEKKREEMKKNILTQTICNIFNVVGSTFSLFGPYAKIVGAVISGASNIAESVLVNTDAGEKPDIISPDGVQNTIDKFNNTMGTLQEPSENFKESINKIAMIIKDIPEIQKVRSLIIKIQSEYIDTPKKELTVVIIKQFSDDIRNEAIKEENGLNGKFAANTSNAFTALDRIKKMNLFADSMFGFVKKQSGNDKALAEIDKAIYENDELIMKLVLFEDHIYNQVIPLLREMFSELLELKDNLKNQSHASLDIKRYQVQKLIRSVKYDMEEITQGFKVETKFMHVFLQIEDAANLLIQLYDRIQNYKEQEELSDYIGALLSSEFKNFQHLDPKYEEAVLQLELVIASNTVVDQYERAKSAFQQQIFPFAYLYGDILNAGLFPKADYNLTDLTHEAVQKFGVMKAKYTEIQATIVSGQDENIYNAEFDSQYNSSHAFYVWDNKDVGKDIKQFLTGIQVFFKANILKSSNKNAIKFNRLELQLKCTDKSLQNELDELLNYFDIELQHGGNNYYRCNNKYFVIPGENQVIAYSFQKDVNGVPIRKNVVYDKILNGDVLLSPYTLWTFKLVNASTEVGFDRLSKFGSEVNLELAGRGLYVKPELEVCETDLENTYEIFEDANNYIYRYSVDNYRNRNWW